MELAPLDHDVLTDGAPPAQAVVNDTFDEDQISPQPARNPKLTKAIGEIAVPEVKKPKVSCAVVSLYMS
jgi:hypothetical protein